MCVQCEILRSGEETMQLQQMLSHHFEVLRELTELHKAGKLDAGKLNEPERRLLAVSRQTDSNKSAIARFSEEYDCFAVDPAVEDRIICLCEMSPDSADSGSDSAV